MAVSEPGPGWVRTRHRLDFTGPGGDADTALAGRADPLLTCSMAVLAANKQGRLAGRLATVWQVEVRPGSPGSVPAEVSAWLECAAPTATEAAELLGEVVRMASDRAARDGTRVTVSALDDENN